jgi:DNA repair protein RAD57
MTDLPTVLPDFPTKAYTHLLPSLDRHGITLTDLLSLDALEIAKRASLPILDLRRLAQDVARAMQHDLDIRVTAHNTHSTHNTSPVPFTSSSKHDSERCKSATAHVLTRWDTISVLDDTLDKAIGGGIPTGYVTEITGERLVKGQLSYTKSAD